jgi:hypothetical protein
VLVIGVIGDYDDRVTFERVMVSRIKADGAVATAFYTVVGRNQPITRDIVSNIVRSRDFSAILLCRVTSLDANSSGMTAANKPVSRAIDLFGYDYEELINPSTFVISGSAVLFAEMFHSADERRMWSIESTIANKQNIQQVIQRAADVIMDQLHNDNLIGN